LYSRHQIIVTADVFGGAAESRMGIDGAQDVEAACVSIEARCGQSVLMKIKTTAKKSCRIRNAPIQKNQLEISPRCIANRGYPPA
jgi:hypothetical protein